MSPGELELVIKSIDRLGHVLVSAGVRRTRLIGNAPVSVRDSATINFELDSSRLGETVESFRALCGDMG